MNYVISIPKISYDIAMDTWLMENMEEGTCEWMWSGAGRNAPRRGLVWNLCFEHEVDLVAFKLRFGV